MIHRRKIQLIAGSTYSITLPKDWIRKNNLKEKVELSLVEKNDRTLIVSTQESDEHKITDITLNVEDYQNNIDQVVLSAYYIGAENINIRAKKELPKDMRSKIRRIIPDMSGTEITFEDKDRLTIKVFLDKSKVDVMQVLYRVGLILDSSLSILLDDASVAEIEVNEDEIDRLYHLMTRIISLSLIDSNILRSSKIHSVSSIPSMFLISKRMENIGDNLYHLAKRMEDTSIEFSGKKEILTYIKNEMSRSVSYIISSKQKRVFDSADESATKDIKTKIRRIKDSEIKSFLIDTLRYTVNIQEELVTLSFYKQLDVLNDVHHKK